MKQRWLMVVFLSFIYLAEPFITGYLAGLNVQKLEYTGPITTSKELSRSLSGTQVQSVFWSLNAGGTITIQLGVKTTGGVIWTSFPGVGPFPVSAGVPEIQPLFIPVVERVKVIFTGTAVGTIALIDS